MTDCCVNCKWLKLSGNDALYPYRCRKEKPGITRSELWLASTAMTGYRCKHFERAFSTKKEEENETD